MQSPKTLSSSAPRLVRSRALENVDYLDSRAPRASARSTLSRGHEDGRDVWGDALNAASAGTSPMTPGPSSVAGASQRMSSAPLTNSIFDADAYIIRDYADLTPPARGRRKRAHGGPHDIATPWLPPLRKRVALEKGASGGRECSFASSGADRATARRGVCDSQLRRGVCDSQLRRGVWQSAQTRRVRQPAQTRCVRQPGNQLRRGEALVALERHV